MALYSPAGRTRKDRPKINVNVTFVGGPRHGQDARLKADREAYMAAPQRFRIALSRAEAKKANVTGIYVPDLDARKVGSDKIVVMKWESI